MDSAPNSISIAASSISSWGMWFSISPAHSRMKALGQYHQRVRLPMPSACSPARRAHTPLRNTW